MNKRAPLILWIAPMIAVCGPVFAAPRQPAGLRGYLGYQNRAVTLTWEPSSDAAGYNIYRRDRLQGPSVRLNPSPVLLNVYADQVFARTFYYTVRAMDTSGAESDDSLIIDSSENTNVIFLADGGQTSIFLPGRASAVLQAANNRYRVPLTIRLFDDFPDAPDVMRDLRFQFFRVDTNEAVPDVSFTAPGADIRIAYGPALGSAAKKISSENPLPQNVTLFWHNGVDWIRLGALNDADARTMRVNSSQLGRFQMRRTEPSQALNLERANVFRNPFSPNGDAMNDRLYIVIENPNGASIEADIYDVDGRHMAALPPPTSTAGIGTTLIWDGRVSDGSIAPGGLYVYRIRGEGKSITGTVAVAR
jgi:hypothetical protein